MVLSILDTLSFTWKFVFLIKFFNDFSLQTVLSHKTNTIPQIKQINPYIKLSFHLQSGFHLFMCFMALLNCKQAYSYYLPYLHYIYAKFFISPFALEKYKKNIDSILTIIFLIFSLLSTPYFHEILHWRWSNIYINIY